MVNQLLIFELPQEVLLLSGDVISVWLEANETRVGCLERWILGVLNVYDVQEVTINFGDSGMLSQLEIELILTRESFETY
jgi:hypothetical protein